MSGNDSKIKICALISSVVIHMALLTVFLQNRYFVIPAKESLPLTTYDQDISIEILSQSPMKMVPKVRMSHESPKRFRTGSRPKRQALDPSLFLLRFNPYDSYQKKVFAKEAATNKTETKVTDTGPQDIASWTDPYQYGKAIERINSFNELTPFFAEIHRRIDSNLYFESNLIEFNHFGRIFFHFAVTPDGQIENKSLQAHGGDRILKVKIARAIRLSLNEAFPISLRLAHSKNVTSESRIWIAAQFFFSNQPSCKDMVSKTTSWLTFCRWSMQRPIARSYWQEIKDSAQIQSFFNENDPYTLKFGVGLNYENLLEYKQKKFRRETAFDPYLREAQDPDWNL